MVLVWEHALKSAHTVFAVVCALPCYSRVDWLIDWVHRACSSLHFFLQNCLWCCLRFCFIRSLITMLIKKIAIDIGTRTCLKIGAHRFCCSLRTPMLFEGWLIDWLGTPCMQFFTFFSAKLSLVLSLVLFHTKLDYYAHKKNCYWYWYENMS